MFDDLCRSLSEGNQAESDQEDDVVFHVGQETVMRIAAKKSVLAQRNQVFRAMFFGSYSVRYRRTKSASDQHSAQPVQVEQIYEPDLDGRAFKNLIGYLNGEPVELRTVVTAVETLHAAEKYLCDGLMKICATYLASQLTADNVLPIYQSARLYAPPVREEVGPAEPSAPSLDQIETDHQPTRLADDLSSDVNQSTASCWCSFLMNSCLEFIDKNATAVLNSEVIYKYKINPETNVVSAGIIFS